MATTYVNLPPCNGTFRSEFQFLCEAAAALGFAGVRFGTDPTYWMHSFATGNIYDGIDQALDAAAEFGLRAHVTLEVHPNYAAASVRSVAGDWCTAAWPVLNRPPAAAYPQMRAFAQQFIDHAIDRWTLSLGQSRAHLRFSWYNEPGTRGPGNCWIGDNAGWNGGFTDTWTLFQAATSAASRQGIWDTSADWTTIAGWAGDVRFQGVSGFRELCEFMLLGEDALDFRGCELVGPAFEAQINGNWFRGDDRATNWELFDRELATRAAWGLTLPFAVEDIHVYVGSAWTFARASLNPHSLADAFRSAAAESIARLRAAIPGARVVCTEFGVRPGWLFGTNQNSGFRERSRGQYWLSLLHVMRATSFEDVGLFELANRYSSDEGVSGENWGVIDLARDWSAGAIALAAGNGAVIDPASDAPPVSGSWITGAGEPAVGPAAPGMG